MKNRYIGRTFITPNQSDREAAVRIKLGALRSQVEGKRIVMVDDLHRRGTTSKAIINLLRSAGAIEVHMRISSPEFISPCYFGTDIPNKDKLIACHHTVEEICQITRADSLEFLSLENLYKIAPDARCGFCDGCFTEHYPWKFPGATWTPPYHLRIIRRKAICPARHGKRRAGHICRMADRSVSGLFAALR